MLILSGKNYCHEDKKARAEQRRLEAWNKQHKFIDGVDHKICNRCKEWLPSNKYHFYKNKKNGIDGLFPYCKKCNIKDSKQWGLDNYERSRKTSRDWYLKEENRIRKNKRDREWRQKNKQYKQEYQLQWQRENKDKIKEYNEQHNIHKITTDEWDNCLKYFDYSCAYCGIHQEKAKVEYDNYLHREHVNHSGADDLSNCVPACKSCNSSKWTFSLSKWYNEVNPNYDKNRDERIHKWLNEDFAEFMKDD